jgi:hypothetical protein
MNLFSKLALILKDRKFRFPSLPSKPSMLRVSLGNQSTGKAVVFAVGLATVVVAVAIFFAVRDVASSHWDWPEAGAEYALPQTMGAKLEPYENGEESHTLQINLASGVRLSTLTLNNLDLGKAGLTDCVTIQRTTNTTGWLFVDTWAMTGVSAPSLSMENIETGNLVLSAYTDGHSMDATIDSTITDLNIISSRGSGVFLAENSVVDRVIIEMHGDAVIGTLTMTNVACSVGGFNIDYVKAGSITMDNTSKFGDGDGINLSDFVVAASVKARTITNNLVDTPITVR